MPITQAYKCPSTSKLFLLEAKPKYVKHLKKIAAKRIEARKLAKVVSEYEAWFAKERHNVTCVNDVLRFIEKNFQRIYTYYYATANRWDSNKYVDDFKMVSISTAWQTYNELTSNTHCSPVSGVENFMREAGKPRGYAGFSCYGNFVANGRNGAVVDEILKVARVWTGSGSGHQERSGKYNMCYEFKIFIDDWEGLQNQALVNKLSGKEWGKY